MNIVDHISDFANSLVALIKQNPFTAIPSFLLSIPQVGGGILDVALESAIGEVARPETSLEHAESTIILWAKFGIWVIFMFFVTARVIYKMLKDRAEALKAERDNVGSEDLKHLEFMINTTESQKSMFIVSNPDKPTDYYDALIYNLKTQYNAIVSRYTSKMNK